MSRVEICISMDPGQPSSFAETQDEKSPNSWVIYQVSHRLRQANEKAYEPCVISIGPYHHGKEHLKEMEDIKKNLFDTTAGKNKKILQAAIKEEEDRIRKCYVETKGFSSKQFVEMVVLDGFFIVQFFRKKFPEFVSGQRFMSEDIRYDLLLLENQLPFFVLQKFHEIMRQNEGTTTEFTDLALKYFEYQFFNANSSKNYTPKENIMHLLDLIHDGPKWHPSNGTEREDEGRNDESKKDKRGSGKNARRRYFIRGAKELEDAGIIFEKRDEKKEGCRALDIEFKDNYRKPKLRIPNLTVDDNTERMLRNLIAFEQSHPENDPTYVFDYVHFIDQLINSNQDAQLLCNSGIIENMLGDYEAVTKVYSHPLDNTYQSPKSRYYGIYQQLNDHCDKLWSKQMANLHRNYFNSPWAFLSFLAALILLFLTIAQTMFALLTIECSSCMVVFIVFGVLVVVIGLILYLYICV